MSTCTCEVTRNVGGCAICREIETRLQSGCIPGDYSAWLKGRTDFFSGDPIAYGDTRQAAIDALNELLDEVLP